MVAIMLGIFKRFFPQKKTEPLPIQEVLTKTWFKRETGIITNLPHADALGTGGEGDLCVDYATLKKIFGKPSTNNGNGKDSKIRKMWIVSIDGVICTIYDWKQGYDYTKPKGGMPLKETRWSVGGSHPISRRLVQGVIDSYLLNDTLPKIVRMERS